MNSIRRFLSQGVSVAKGLNCGTQPLRYNGQATYLTQRPCHLTPLLSTNTTLSFQSKLSQHSFAPNQLKSSITTETIQKRYSPPLMAMISQITTPNPSLDPIRTDSTSSTSLNQDIPTTVLDTVKVGHLSPTRIKSILKEQQQILPSLPGSDKQLESNSSPTSAVRELLLLYRAKMYIAQTAAAAAAAQKNRPNTNNNTHEPHTGQCNDLITTEEDLLALEADAAAILYSKISEIYFYYAPPSVQSLLYDGFIIFKFAAVLLSGFHLVEWGIHSAAPYVSNLFFSNSPSNPDPTLSGREQPLPPPPVQNSLAQTSYYRWIVGFFTSYPQNIDTFVLGSLFFYAYVVFLTRITVIFQSKWYNRISSDLSMLWDFHTEDLIRTQLLIPVPRHYYNRDKSTTPLPLAPSEQLKSDQNYITPSTIDTTTPIDKFFASFSNEGHFLAYANEHHKALHMTNPENFPASITTSNYPYALVTSTPLSTQLSVQDYIKLQSNSTLQGYIEDWYRHVKTARPIL